MISQWVKATDIDPPENGRYLVFISNFTSGDCIYIASFENDRWKTQQPLYWMSLPEFPDQTENKATTAT